MSGDSRLVTLDEADELNALQGGSGMTPGLCAKRT